MGIAGVVLLFAFFSLLIVVKSYGLALKKMSTISKSEFINNKIFSENFQIQLQAS